MRKINNRVIRYVSVVLSMVIYLSFAFNKPADIHADINTDLEAMAQEILWLTNEARADAGVPPLKVVPYLCDVSNVRSRECIFKFSHDRIDPVIMPDGTEEYRFFTVIDDSLVPWEKAAENIAAGPEKAEDAFAQWKGSEKHFAAILNPEYTHFGVSVTYDPNSEYKYYWEQIFVRVDGSIDGEYVPERYKVVPVDTGDINGDKQIDLFDLITINKYIEGKITFNELQLKSADMAKDGEVDEADIFVLKKYILGDCSKLPVNMKEYGELIKEKKI
ncbi:CAP domain-containing protein [Ruminococcus flavefaciens]|uniref:Dockerin domain-containing protein n=1 Tax=Ruminococcus flavefaciens 007c TaxID=1341157 RepID=W7UCL3_RUMFL|nr:CAP domain-containing protein [Ruminococcus flavefaciens]EWM52816.1 hypothetical protein RF007C_14475 [Ruminococcus flavefaciens 007c]